MEGGTRIGEVDPKTAELRLVLRTLRGANGVVASTIISRDGLPLASDLPPGVDPDTLALRGAFMQGIADLVMGSMEQEAARTVVVVAERHYIVTTPVNDATILVVVVDRSVELGSLLHEARDVAEQVRVSMGG